MNHEPAGLPCQHISCPSGITADLAHLPNLTAPVAGPAANTTTR